MGRAGGLLVDGTAEEHLRIGALEDAGVLSSSSFLGFCRKTSRLLGLTREDDFF